MRLDRFLLSQLGQSADRLRSVSTSFDHQMVIHTATSRLFVFGGKNQPFTASGGYNGDPSGANPSASLLTDATRSRYSGMWCYHLDSGKWTHLLYVRRFALLCIPRQF